MENKLLLLRACYWGGAILDGLAAIYMIFPNVFALVYNLPGFNPGVDYFYAMGMGASLMLGWTVLLLWADRKPIERRGILLITFFPVIIGLIINSIMAILLHFIPFPNMLPILILQIITGIVFLLVYQFTEDLKT
ncbi:MAG: hypothetical protein ACFFDP_05910 [Promethearchaeota archaeon]